MTPVLFSAAGLAARELQAAEVPLLQALFDAHPEYFLTVNGRRANPGEAQEEFDEMPPPALTYTRRWFLGLFRDDGQDDGVGPNPAGGRGPGTLQGVAVVVSDLCAATVWHVTLFLLATPLHGSGQARAVYAALEAWMHGQGARWLRLGVVAGNARGERFWQRNGYAEVRVREGVDTGGRLNTLRVMMKPLAGGTLAQYLALVPRDRPDSALP